jgi:hypothetical protein
MPLSKLHLSQLNRARNVGGTPSIYLSNRELTFLLCIVCHDLNLDFPDNLPCQNCLPESHNFYDITPSDIRCGEFDDEANGNQHLADMLESLILIQADSFTYFLALASIHAQRRKFRAILSHQPMPDLETVLPRGLLELGGMPVDALASWLVWRKFIYDVDNRSAQTAGYLFEPILAASIGGVPYSARKSPVKRNGTGSGRQVDCILNKDAYEFKMRVTIAASGQGRFAEELSFAEDCHLSGYRPILLVLDPTSSTKLTELTRVYQQFDGEAYVGLDAWNHLEQKAGVIMAQFLEKYVRTPLARIDDAFIDLPPLTLEFSHQTNSIILSVGNHRVVLR